uniref:RNA-directed DNA polymerase n=1 Tax=Pristionchus pacificus TaxID=54126 RepID=A0A8R1Y8P5_PRIPA
RRCCGGKKRENRGKKRGIDEITEEIEGNRRKSRARDCGKTLSTVMDAIQPAPMDVEEKTMASNGGSGAVLEEEKPTPASRVQTRAKTEEIRKNEMNVTERMTTEYALITRAIKNCRDKVKSQTSLRVGGEVTVVNDLFKVAMKEADKAWESVVNAVNTTMEALEGKESSEREMNFLGNVQLNSLEEAETVIRENREQLEQFRELTKEVKEIEGVEDIVGLLEKINGEREAVARERSEWEIVEAELLELKGMAELRENENLTDKWKDVNDELQTLREQFAELKKKMEEGEVDSLLLVDNVESLEGQVARLERENKRMKEINEDTLARLVRAEDANAGQNSSNQNGSVLDQHALSESDRISENMRRQREALQRMRMRQGCGGVSSPPSDSRASPRTRGQHTSTTPIAGAYSLGTIETGNGGMGNVSVGGSGDSNGIMGKSVGLMANALPRMARYSGKKEEWENFETGFMIRFGKMDTVVAMSLLNDHLFGEAKDALRSVPVEEKAKGVKGVLTWLRSRLSNETPFEEIEVSRMLRHQKINGRSVGKVCEELEELTARLHRDEVNKETERKRQLMFLFEGKYKEHVRLLGLFREGASYSAMKAALVELEYMRRTEREFKAYTEGVGSSGPRCFNCGKTSHKANQCNSRNGKGGGSGGSGSGANGHSGSMGTSGGANGTYRGGYSGPSRGGYSSGRGGYNNGSGQKPQQNNGYGNGGARAHSVAAPANGYNSGRSYTNVGTGANSVPLGHKSSCRDTSILEIIYISQRSVRDVDDFFFIKRRELVKGKVNGVPVQVLLDTGADVSIISADVVDKIDGAVVEKGVSPMIKDASNGVMDIVGRTILEVELEVGNRTQVGFYVLNNGLGKVIIGGKGLDDVGVELKEVRFREKTHSNGDDAIVLRDAQIGPGQLGSIWVKGSEHNTVMLESSVDQVMEGIAVTERIVHIPVFNDTESELQFTKYQPVGVWRVVEGAVEEMHAGQKGEGIVSDNRASEVIWKEIREKLVKNRSQELEKSLEQVLWRNIDAFAKDLEALAIFEAARKWKYLTFGTNTIVRTDHAPLTSMFKRQNKQKNNNDVVIREREESILRWKTAQGSDEWVQEMIQKKSEIAIGRGDASEMTRMPDSTRKLTMADLEIDKGTLYVLDRDHERLLYVPRSERKGLIKEMHESVLVGHAGGKKMNQMLRKKYVWGAMEKDIAAVLRDCDLLVGRTEEWEDALPYALYCYNTVPHGSTGESPAFLLHGRDVGLPLGETVDVDERYVVDMDDYKSRMMLLMKRTQNEVNERLKGERERMKVSYDKRWENNKKYEPIIGDRVYVFKEKGDGKNPKLRINRLVNRESPLHWENPCPGCLDKPRPLSALWSSCPSDFASFSFPTLKEYAIIRAIIEKDLYPWVIWMTTKRSRRRSLRRRRGLGEEVESSIGYGAVIHQPGVPLTRCGGDRARWEWKREMHTQWNEIFAGWHRLRTKKTIKSLLIFWPRAMQKDDMVSLKDVVVYHTERNAWNEWDILRVQGGATDPEYVPFLVDWSVDQPKTGRIRVIVTSNAITDGTPISALERCHSWIRRDHYEFAAQAWIDGKPWDIKKAESELEEKGWRTKETKVVEEVTYRVDTPKLNQVIKDKNRRELEKAECFECGSTEHKAWKCTRKDKNKKAYYGRGRPAAKEGDVMEPTHKKKRY